MSTALYDIPATVAPVIMAGDGVAEYERVSRDRKGAGLAVKRQRHEIHDRAARDGEPLPTRVYSDNDMSAYSGKPRPDYIRLLSDIAAGLVRVLWVWHTDRLHRSNRELEEFISVIEKAERDHGIRVEIRTVIGSPIDLNTAAGRGNARFLCTVATMESDIKRERIRAKVAEKVRNGEFHGGKRRWGYNADMSAHDVTEANIIRGLAADVIKGRSLHSMAKELNANGTPPPLWRGVPFVMSKWTGSNLGTLLRRPHLVGDRVHKRNGVTVISKGTWKPILDRETFDAVVAVLSGEGRRTSPEGTARKYFLTGLATCAECGKALQARPGNKKRGDADAYKCPDLHMQRAAPMVDLVVTEAALGRLAMPDAAAATLPQVLDGLAGNADVAAVWDGLDLDRRRAVVAALMDVSVRRAARKGAPFNPDDVVIRWKGSHAPN